jgi:hypothetical protein
VTVFIYCHIPSGTAWAQAGRIPPNVRGVAYCFDVPVDWLPETQSGFEKMMKSKGYFCGPNYKWQGLFEES